VLVPVHAGRLISPRSRVLASREAGQQPVPPADRARRRDAGGRDPRAVMFIAGVRAVRPRPPAACAASLEAAQVGDREARAAHRCSRRTASRVSVPRRRARIITRRIVAVLPLRVRSFRPCCSSSGSAGCRHRGHRELDRLSNSACAKVSELVSGRASVARGDKLAKLPSSKPWKALVNAAIQQHASRVRVVGHPLRW
jgi:hypothetical protein